MTDTNTNPEVTCSRCGGRYAAGLPKCPNSRCNGTGAVSNPGGSGLEAVAELYVSDVGANGLHTQTFIKEGVDRKLGVGRHKLYASPISQVEGVEAEIIERCAQAAEGVSPRHTECGNKIAAAIRKLAASPSSTEGNQG